MNNLAQRALTALIAGSVAMFCIIFSPYTLMGLGAIITALCIWEYLGLADITDLRYRIPAVLISFAAWGIAYIDFQYWQSVFLILPLCGILFLTDAKATDVFNKMAKWLFGLAYCIVPFIVFYKMSFRADGIYDWQIPLGILLLNWVMDTFAYFGGRTIGKNPMAPRISPKKTWEGTAVGFVTCWIVGFVLQYTLKDPEINWLIVTAIVSVINQPGDLIESMIKRSVQVKDSGSILPGHGGILDRCDSLFILFPIIYFYFSMR